MTLPTVAYFWGDDDFAADKAIVRFADAISAEAGGPVERVAIRGDRNHATALIGQLQAQVATQSLFGGGTLAVVTNVGALTVKNEDRDALLAVLPLVAPGNAIVFVEASATGAKEPGQKRVVALVKAAGGEVRPFWSPKAGQLAGWIEAEARQRDMKLATGAARELALRIGGYVTDNDADRRNQTRMAAHELDKLALYRDTEPVSVDDVRALVAEAVPGSVWALTDAVGQRDAAKASALLERLAPSTPEPVLLAVFHRRIRELLEVADLVAGGAREESLAKTLGLHSFRAQLLTTQARRWTVAELQAALEDLLELDAAVKGAPGSPSRESQRRLGFTLWIADRVAPARR
jgi:DNA polymerase-3 subunit delta